MISGQGHECPCGEAGRADHPLGSCWPNPGDYLAHPPRWVVWVDARAREFRCEPHRELPAWMGKALGGGWTELPMVVQEPQPHELVHASECSREGEPLPCCPECTPVTFRAYKAAQLDAARKPGQGGA